MNIPIQTQPSNPATITVATLDQPVFIIGPKPYPRRNISKWLLLRAFDAAWRLGLVIGAVTLLMLLLTMLAWPSFGRYVEQFGWFVGEQIESAVEAITT